MQAGELIHVSQWLDDSISELTSVRESLNGVPGIKFIAGTGI